MAYICTCGEKVKHSWEHEECAISNIVKEHKGTILYKIAKRDFPELVEKFEKKGIEKDEFN